MLTNKMSSNKGKDNFGLITDDIEGRLPSEEYITMTGDFAKGAERQSDYLDINDDVFEMASLNASIKRDFNAATFPEVERNVPATCTRAVEENLYVKRECPIKSNKMKKGKQSCIYAVTTLSKESEVRAIKKSFSAKQVHTQDLYSYAALPLPTIKKSRSLDILPGSVSMKSLIPRTSVSSIAESSSEIYLTPTKSAQSDVISRMDSEVDVGRCQSRLSTDVGSSLKEGREEANGLDQSFQFSPKELSGKAIK